MAKYPLHHDRVLGNIKHLWKIAVAVFLLSAAASRAEEKPRLDVWLIDTRCAPTCGDWQQGKASITFWRLDENQQWSAATAASFTESPENNTPNVFLLHGNDVNRNEAVRFAWPVYCRLSKELENRPYRLVIWSWPSDRICRRIRADVQTKADFCDSQSYYLADCLRGMKSSAPTSLVGYSFGAKILCGGLHLLGGGSIAGQCLPPTTAEESNPPKGPIRAVLVAAAMDCQSLAPGQEYGCAPSQAESMLVTQNGCDSALRFYHRLYGRGGPDALGYVGPCCWNGENLHLFDVTCAVGKTHQWENYIYCSGLFGLLPHYLFLD